MHPSGKFVIYFLSYTIICTVPKIETLDYTIEANCSKDEGSQVEIYIVLTVSKPKVVIIEHITITDHVSLTQTQTTPVSHCIPGAIYHIQYNTSISRKEIQTNDNVILLTKSLEEVTISIAITPESELGVGPTWTDTIHSPADVFPRNYCKSNVTIGSSTPETSSLNV